MDGFCEHGDEPSLGSTKKVDCSMTRRVYNGVFKEFLAPSSGQNEWVNSPVCEVKKSRPATCHVGRLDIRHYEHWPSEGRQVRCQVCLVKDREHRQNSVWLFHSWAAQIHIPKFQFYVRVCGIWIWIAGIRWLKGCKFYEWKMT